MTPARSCALVRLVFKPVSLAIILFFSGLPMVFGDAPATRLTIRYTGTDFEGRAAFQLQWNAVPNANYLLQKTSSLAPGVPWETVDMLTPASSTGLTEIKGRSIPENSVEFYRLLLPQPEIFTVKYPEQKSNGPEKEVTEAADNGSMTPKEAAVVIGVQKVIVHDTVVHIDSKRVDTVYIEKRDTIYLGQPGENPMSMEGYATNNLVFLLDVSGSMNTGQKLPLLKKSMLVLLNMLRPLTLSTTSASSSQASQWPRTTSMNSSARS